MRELILKMSMSIDGFVGTADGRVKWIFDSDREAIAWTVETVWNASLHIMGSKTVRDMAAYWPTSTLDVNLLSPKIATTGAGAIFVVLPIPPSRRCFLTGAAFSPRSAPSSTICPRSCQKQ